VIIDSTNFVDDGWEEMVETGMMEKKWK